MLNDVRLFFRGEFNRNVLTLMTGTGLAQLIPIAATPLLSRIYSPEQYGLYGLFVALVSSMSALATGRYEMAIMLPRKQSDAAAIAALSIGVSLVVSVVLLGIAGLSNEQIANGLGNSTISTWLYVVPLAVLLNGIYMNLNYWSNRNKWYVLMSQRRVLHSGGTCGAQLGLGLLGAGAGGLVVGSVAGQALAAAMMAKAVQRQGLQHWRGITRRKLWALAKRYRSCPLLLAPAHTLSALSIQLPALFFGAAFGLAGAGLFVLVEKAVGTPLSLVSAAVGDVFRQQISQCYIAGEHCRREFLSTFRKLLAIATPPFLLLLFFAPPLFALVFGEKWRSSGEYAQLMAPMFYLRFICNPLSQVAIIAQRNRFEFFWQSGLLMCLLLCAASYYVFPLDIRAYIMVFVCVYGVFDLVILLAAYLFACAGDARGPARRRR